MPTATITESQRKQALDALAKLGGALLGEDDITFSGTKFILPQNLSLGESINFLEQRRDDEENETQFSRTFPYRPFDGARATANAIREAFGFTLGKTLRSFFGSQPPEMINVQIGPGHDDVEQVPWGAMQIPGLRNTTLYLGEARDAELGRVFEVTVRTPRKNRHTIEGLFVLIAKHLREDSIYKGKAIDGGENFLDVTSVNREDVVYTKSVQQRLDGDLWKLIKHEKLLAKLGQDGKYAVLLSGDYGTGKSLAALLTAQIAVENGWTFLMCRPGKDNLVQILELARMYQPAVVFGEDIDTMAGPQSGSTIERHLDTLDGIKTKGLKLIAVFTTNHAEDIHKGMLRPGRIGAVIRIGAMDREGVERLGRRVIGDALMEDTNWDLIWDSVQGYMPAFIKEVFARSIRYTIDGDGNLGPIGTEAICLAADSLRDQHDLMQGAKEEKVSDTVSSAIHQVVVKAIDGADIRDYDGDSQYQLSINGG